MVNPAKYEELQLELITKEYEQRGYRVTREPGPTGRAMERRRLRADATAVDPKTGDRVWIEIVNGRGKLAVFDERVRLLKQQLEAEPGWQLDVRYIDNPFLVWERAAIGASLPERMPASPPTVQSAKSLPRARGDEVGGHSANYLRLWAIFAQSLRAWSSAGNAKSASAPQTASLEFLWSTLCQLSNKPALAPDDPLTEFPRLKDLAFIAVEGGVLREEDVALLRCGMRSLLKMIHSPKPTSD